MRSLISKPNVDSAVAAFPYGRIKDNTGANDGTPVNEEVYGDTHQFFEKLMAESLMVANGLPDNNTNGFQLYAALLKTFNIHGLRFLFNALYENYTTGQVVILYGCSISATIPGTSTITAGAIYYEGQIYEVDAASVITTGPQTLVFGLDQTEEPYRINLQAGASGTGITTYNSPEVKYLDKLYNKAEQTDVDSRAYQAEVDDIQTLKADKDQGVYTAITLINGWTGTLAYRKDQFGIVNIKGVINNVSATYSEFFSGFLGIKYKTGVQGFIPVTGTHNSTTVLIGGVNWPTSIATNIYINNYPNKIPEWGTDHSFCIDLWYFAE